MGLVKESSPVVWVVIPSRARVEELREQVSRLLPQLGELDRIVIISDGCAETQQFLASTDAWVVGCPLARSVGPDRCRRIGSALVPSDAVVLEVDDHDWVEPDALEAIRKAFLNPNILAAYSDCHHTDSQRQITRERVKINIESPTASFAMQGNLAWGLRAYRKWAYDLVGGYPLRWFPCNDYMLMCAIEQTFGKQAIQYIQESLVTVVSSVDGISYKFKKLQADRMGEVAQLALDKHIPVPFYYLQPKDVPNTELGSPLKGGEEAPVEPSSAYVLVIEDRGGFGRGGGQVSLFKMLDRLRAKGITARYAYVSEEKRSDIQDAIHIKQDISGLLAKQAPDLVIAQGRPEFWESLISACKVENIPVVSLMQFWRPLFNLSSGDVWDALNGGSRDEVERFVDSRAKKLMNMTKAVIVNGPVVEQRVADILDVPIRVVRPPVSAEEMRVDNAPPLEKRNLILCPSGQEAKGLHIFLKLAGRYPQFDFVVLAGDVKGKVEGRVPDNVTVVSGWVLADKMKVYYHHARMVFIGTLTCETWSRSATEARLNGIPLLVTDSGNLPNFIENPQDGTIVSRDAGFDEYRNAFDKTLECRPEKSDKWCVDDTDVLYDTVQRTRRLSEVSYYVLEASGVYRSAKELNAVCGVTLLRKHDLPRGSVVIFPSRWDNDIPGLAKEYGFKPAIHWHSHTAQMDTNRHEQEEWILAMRGLESCGGIMYMTGQDCAESFSAVGCAVRWLPNVYSWPEISVTSEFEGNNNVFIPGPYQQRKNILTALLATREIGGIAHVTDWLKSQCPEGVELAAAIGLDLRIHSVESIQEVQYLAARCQVAVCISLAETFCFSAADCVAVGTPLVHWIGIPCMSGYPQSELCVYDPTSSRDVAESIQLALNDRTMVEKQQVVLREVCEYHESVVRKEFTGCEF